MTVQTETSRSGPYAGAGTTGPFTVGFRFLDNTHLQVIRTSATGIDSTLVLTTDYSVSGAGGASGTVTLVTALAFGERLTVIRDVPFTQLADYINNDAFPAESHEDALDLLTMQTQQNREALDRSLTLPATVSGVSTELPAPSGAKVLGWNAAGTALENLDANTLASIIAYGTAVGDLFSGTGAETEFALSQNPASINNLDVSIGGVAQRPVLDYTWTSGTTLTFTTAPVAGTDNILVRYMQALAMGSGAASDIQYTPAGTGAVASTVQAKLRESVSVLDFGAVGDGMADDTAAFALAVATNKTVVVPAGTYRITSSITIPTSTFTRFVGEGNRPIEASNIFVDFNGYAFVSNVGSTSFYCFENLRAYSTASYASAGFLKDSGAAVHCRIRMSLENFKNKAIDLATAFECDIDILIRYCWDYGLKVSAGSSTTIKFVADHTYGGGIDVFGVGFKIYPYTENACQDNNPAGANASFREMKIGGGAHTVIGGVLSVYSLNNKYPIELAAGRGITFVGVRGFSLGGAPHWINLNANDSSLTAIDCPDFTYGGTTTNLIVIDGGYTTTKPDIKIGSSLGVNSLVGTVARAWTCFDGTNGIQKQSNNVSGVVRNSTGNYTITFQNAFANENYVVLGTAKNDGAVVVVNVLSKAAGSVTVGVNNTASTAGYDSGDVCVAIIGL